MLEETDDGGLDLTGREEVVRKRSDPSHIWKVKPRGFPAGLNVVREKKKEARDGPNILV